MCNKILVTIVLILCLALETQAQCPSCNKCDERKTGFNARLTNNNSTNTSVSENQKDNIQMNLDEVEDDEFEEFTEFDGSEDYTINTLLTTHDSRLTTTLFVLLAVILTGVFVRFKPSRHLRVIFMLGFLVYLGFYLGGCPCPISAYQNVILATLGNDIGFIWMLYFIGLIPITYFFGKVWCGWICHLGTLQELLHIHKKFNFLKSRRSQSIMHGIRFFLFFGLIFQLIITQTNWFCKIDPFLVAFNFISVYPIGWYLLGLLLLTSVFIHRPFCQSACPIGLVLGWISKIPGASHLAYNENCTHCNVCVDSCKIGAITKDNGNHFINNTECNFCGDCLDSCTNNSIRFTRKNIKLNSAITILFPKSNSKF